MPLTCPHTPSPILTEERTLHRAFRATAKVLLGKRTPLRDESLTAILSLSATGKRLRAIALTPTKGRALRPLHLCLDAVAHEFSNSFALLRAEIL